MVDLEAPAKIRLEQLTISDFGPSDGGVARVRRGMFEAHEVEFRNNVTATSGAVLDIAEGAEASFTNVTFANNDASVVVDGNGWGGVINAGGANTRVTVDKSTASGNRAMWGSFAHVHDGATLSMSNSTLHHNTVKVAGTLATPSGSFELTNVTIAYNRNENGDSPRSAAPAGIYIDGVPGGYKMANSIVAFNTDVSGAQNNCGNKGAADHLDSLGGNLFSDGAGNCASSFTQDGDGLSIDRCSRSRTRRTTAARPRRSRSRTPRLRSIAASEITARKKTSAAWRASAARWTPATPAPSSFSRRPTFAAVGSAERNHVIWQTAPRRRVALTDAGSGTDTAPMNRGRYVSISLLSSVSVGLIRGSAW